MLARGAAAEPLRFTVEEAVSRAASNNTDLHVSRHDLEVAEANVDRSSAWLPGNPFVSLGFSSGHTGNSGNAGAMPQAGSVQQPDTGGRSNYYGSLSQELEVANQRGPRSEAAAHARDRQTWDVKNIELDLAAAVRTAFVRSQVNLQRVSLAQTGVELATDLARHLSDDEPASGLDRIELNAARIQELRARRELAEAERNRDDSMDSLRRLLDIPFDQRIELVGGLQTTQRSIAPLQDLIALALEQRPDLVALRHGSMGAAAQVGLVQRERIPNVNLSASVSKFENTTYAGGDVGFALPVFHTKSGDIQEALSERDRLTDQIKSLAGDVEMQVRAAYRACAIAAKDVEVDQQSIVPLSEENERIERRLLDRDEVSVSDLIGQQIDLLTARRAHLDAVESLNTACIELEHVVAGPLDRAVPTPP
jgi:cobalt-zinc-cadmium efflux system outer membrane protein